MPSAEAIISHVQRQARPLAVAMLLNGEDWLYQQIAEALHDLTPKYKLALIAAGHSEYCDDIAS